MSRLSTCKSCGNKISSENKKTYQGKSYCVECYNKLSIESEQYKMLINMVHELAKKSYQKFNPMVYSQIKDFKEKYNFSYSGMRYTLWYINEILNKVLDIEKYGIALVQYEYTNAQNWYSNQKTILNEAEKKDIHKSSKINTFIKVKPKLQTINLNRLVNIGKE